MEYGNLASMSIETQIFVTIRGLIFLAYKSRSTALNFEGLQPIWRSNASSYGPWTEKTNEINSARDLK